MYTHTLLCVELLWKNITGKSILANLFPSMKWGKKIKTKILKKKDFNQSKTKKVQTLVNNWNIEFISGHPIIDISYLFNTYTYFLWENSLDSDLEQDFIFIKRSHLCFGCKRICNH